MTGLIKQVQEACAAVCDGLTQKSLGKQSEDVSELSNVMLRHYALSTTIAAEKIRTIDLSHLTDWEDISTAPKDGTVIILFGNGRVTAGHWEPERWPVAAEYHGKTGEYLGQYETGECIPAWWYSEDGGFAEDSPPTHWMPLPAPPKPSK